MGSSLVFKFEISDTDSKYDDFFHAVGYDEILATSSPMGQASMKLLNELETGLKYIRIHNMFTGSQGDLRGRVDAGCNPIVSYNNGEMTFDWTKMDSVFDVLIENDFMPYIEFGFMPPQLTSAKPDDKKLWRYPPKDYNAWRILIRETVQHFKERYPEYIDQFIWEVWNEPNRFFFIIPGYFDAKSIEYFKLYDYTVAGLFDVFPNGNFKVGGPALAGEWFPFLHKFIKHCLFEKNHVNGGIGTKLDFISFHLKGGAYFQTPNIKKIIRNLHKHMKLIEQYKKHGRRMKRKRNPKFLPDDVEIHITELDPVVGCARGIESKATLNFRNTEYYSAYTGLMATWLQYVRLQHNYNIKWVFSDNVHFADEAALLEIFNGCRSLTTAPFQADTLDEALKETRVIAKPVVKAFQALDRMKGQMLEKLHPKTNVFDNITAFATRNNNTIKILISHFNPKFNYDEKKEVSIEIHSLKAASEAKIKEFIIDDTRNNTYRTWVDMGRPLDLTDQKYSKIKVAEKLNETGDWNNKVKDGKLEFSITCNPQSLHYYEIKLNK